MQRLALLAFLAASTACAADMPVVRLHDDYTMLNGAKVESVEALLKQLDASKNKGSISIEAHLCLDTKRLISAIDQIKEKGYTNVHLSGYGSGSDADCH